MATPTENLAGQAQAPVVAEADEFSALLKREFKPKSEEANEAVQRAVRTLAQQALLDTSLVSEDAVRTIESMIAEIDKKLTQQINKILHHQDYQKLESAWRGLHYLVNNTETDEMLKIRVMNVSKNDLGRTLKRYKGTAWDQSPLFKKVYEAEDGQLRGEPFGAIVGDYYFDQSPPDVELLGELAKNAAAAHCPFISASPPSLFQKDSWQELANPRDLTKIFQTPEYTAWRSLRESDDAKYVGLAMPRFLARLPYGAKTNPVEQFNFEEETESGSHNRYSWANAAYAMSVNITRAFKLYGWCTPTPRAEAGGPGAHPPVPPVPPTDGPDH